MHVGVACFVWHFWDLCLRVTRFYYTLRTYILFSHSNLPYHNHILFESFIICVTYILATPRYIILKVNTFNTFNYIHKISYSLVDLVQLHIIIYCTYVCKFTLRSFNLGVIVLGAIFMLPIYQNIRDWHIWIIILYTLWSH